MKKFLDVHNYFFKEFDYVKKCRSSTTLNVEVDYVKNEVRLLVPTSMEIDYVKKLCSLYTRGLETVAAPTEEVNIELRS